jgi:hypothetical protein
MTKEGSNLGPFFLIAVAVVVFLLWRSAFGFNPVPWLRGIHLGLPLVGILAAAIVVVIWAGKFVSFK